MPELDNWIKVIEKSPKTGWIAFYESTMHQPVTNTETLLWCVDTYGMWPTFEAILAAGKRKLSNDPLPYVLSVAQAKWKDAFMQMSDDGKYRRGIQRSKQRTNEQNEELEEKLRKARGE